MISKAELRKPWKQRIREYAEKQIEISERAFAEFEKQIKADWADSWPVKKKRRRANSRQREKKKGEEKS